jgi:ribosome recycling factor
MLALTNSMAVDDILLEAEEKMIKSSEVIQTEFAGIRTGKASPDLVTNLMVEAYGSHMRLKELAAITTPDSRLILIQPWDASTVDAVRKALEESKLGISPQVDGKLIRLPIPPLSEERRQDLVKAVRKMAEEGRVSIRANRRHALDEIKKLHKSGEITEDQLGDAEKEVQKLTDQYVAEVEKGVIAKEAELMKV